jgi:hypothetical protein
LRGKVEANGLLSATGALAALTRPDSTPPSAFSVARPAFTFRSPGAGASTFVWQPSRDPELEGYSLTIDGTTTILPASARTFQKVLRPGVHHWQLYAYDLSGNHTVATAPRRPLSPVTRSRR